jgi:MYXO-CTERM domain-containing protein
MTPSRALIEPQADLALADFFRALFLAAARFAAQRRFMASASFFRPSSLTPRFRVGSCAGWLALLAAAFFAAHRRR